MITSMTGYGQSVVMENRIEVNTEVRSVNNRYLDISLKTPKSLSNYEGEIRELVGKYAARGRVNLWVTVKREEEKYENLDVNHALVTAYLRLGRELSDQYGVDNNLDVKRLFELPDVIIFETEDQADQAVWNCAKKSIKEALIQMKTMRDREGKEIEADFRARIKRLKSVVNDVESIALNGPKIELEKLRERVRGLVSKKQLNEPRLETELAIIADKIDISEECTRFSSHNTVFLELLDKPVSQGRKLNFLLQEMNREANTMAAKAFTSDILARGCRAKEEIEKIREQVQNIE
ncbi:MAG: YicC/YloC family endoribonuclease [candidate division KSB1 bacterium]|nr:YicC/YloC family endoribonuclease [candidate division KSB1 bacterium]